MLNEFLVTTLASAYNDNLIRLLLQEWSDLGLCYFLSLVYDVVSDLSVQLFKVSRVIPIFPSPLISYDTLAYKVKTTHNYKMPGFAEHIILFLEEFNEFNNN